MIPNRDGSRRCSYGLLRRIVKIVVIDADIFVFALCVNAARFFIELAHSCPELCPSALGATGKQDAIATSATYQNFNATNWTSLSCGVCHGIGLKVKSCLNA